LAGLLLASPGTAGEWSFSGVAGAEFRWFANPPGAPRQLEETQASGFFSPELRWRSEDRRHQVTVIPYGRWDGEDDERSHVDLREGYYRFVGDEWEVLAGVNRVFWGVAESRHLVDVVNQTDLVEDLDDEDELGQPMIQIGWQRDLGRFELLALIGFRERTFPGEEGRLRPPLVVDERRSSYESSAEDDRIDLAARWSHYLGDWDLGAHAFLGTSREPRLVPLPPATLPGPPTLVPAYDTISQVGVDLQFTRDAWLWKAEGLVREGSGDTFGAVVAGFERTLYQLGGTSADLGLLLELHYDGREATAPPTIYDDDIFVGTRLALNDSQDTAVLAGALIDRGDGSTAVFLEAERRLGSRFTLEIEGRAFLDASPSGDLAFLADDDLVTLRFSWNF
jgi:hypothetical protein